MEILPGIHQVDGVNANSYFVIGDEIMLIDTGMPRNAKKILDYLHNTLGRNPSDIKTIVLTHYHLDHTGNLFDLKEITKAKVAVHHEDEDYISEGKVRQPSGYEHCI
jgi:hydroxyacylglutathione hydrolase